MAFALILCVSANQFVWTALSIFLVNATGDINFRDIFDFGVYALSFRANMTDVGECDIFFYCFIFELS